MTSALVGVRRHLLSIADLKRDELIELLALADSFAEVVDRPIPKVPTLRGRTVATLFFEASTRTRLSFETAAKRLSADTMSFSVSGSSMAKGESLRDTVETLDAMGIDVMVVRHHSAGAPHQVARWVRAAVVNAGDGQHEHPTQALLDCFTLREVLAERAGGRPPEDLCGLKVAIVGDVRHSRVARSDVLALSALGAEVHLVAPATLMPCSLEGWPIVGAGAELDALVGEMDAIYLLRLQLERMSAGLLPSLREYATRFGLSTERAMRMKDGAVVLHPGPMNRGVEIDAAVASSERARVTRQVRNGVAVRMAVLFHLLEPAGGAPAPLEGLADRAER